MENKQINIFGEISTEEKRKMSDYFGVAPFSTLNTTDSVWQARRRKWNVLIGDNGIAREGALMGTGQSNSKIATSVKNMNNGVSILDACLAELIVKWFTIEGMKTFDCFAGDTIFGFVSAYLNRPFKGIELRKEQAEFNQNQCDKHELDAQYICDTSENMNNYIKDESVDFVFSCPPYADLEVYSDNPKDLSTMPHDEFFELYEKILKNTFTKLKPNRFACIVTSEVRNKKGEYIGLVPKTINIMRDAGYMFWNEMILINSVGTLPLRVGRFMNATRKVGRRHQNVLVFYKGNPKEIKNIFGELIPKNTHYES